MKRKAKIIGIILAVTVAVILLKPRAYPCNDGGTVKYCAVLYEVDKWHAMTANEGEYWVGYTVEILGITVYDHRELIIEKE